MTEFFPQSAQYEYAEIVEFEVYSSEDTSDLNYQCEIWIAVNEKAKKSTRSAICRPILFDIALIGRYNYIV